MIKNIKIENFRCFENLKVAGFGRVNLISGRNNVGKTALLEAILLNSNPISSTIIFLRQLRKESFKFAVGSMPNRVWDNFYFQQNTNHEIVIESILVNSDSKAVEILVDQSTFVSLAGDTWEDESGEYMGTSTLEDRMTSINLKMTVNGKEVLKTHIASGSKGLLPSDDNTNISKSALFVTSFSRISNRELTSEFGKAYLNGKYDNVLNGFKAIDNSITKVETIFIDEPRLYLSSNGRNRLPLSLFGDATNRVADITLKLVNNENSILLIDEIENGIHHSSQIDFWDVIYKLATELNVQVFATTHSLEMTQAFVKAGLEHQNQAAHFELVRQAKTDKIVAIKRDLDTLDYGISHNEEVRGG